MVTNTTENLFGLKQFVLPTTGNDYNINTVYESIWSSTCKIVNLYIVGSIFLYVL